MRIVKTICVLFSLTFFFSFSEDKQCKGFVKKKCMSKLSPFISNGQMNIKTLSSGERVEMPITFYSGQSYRILVCAQENFGNVQFKLKDADNTVLFNSKKQDETDFWDFNVASTQQLTVEVTVPSDSTENKIVSSGCVAILVGFKK